MRVHGKLVIVPNKSDGNCITTAFRWCLRMADPIPLPACLLMFAVHVNACATALILHCNVTSPIFSRFCPVSLPAFPSLDIYRRTCMYIYVYIASIIRPIRSLNRAMGRTRDSDARKSDREKLDACCGELKFDQRCPETLFLLLYPPWKWKINYASSTFSCNRDRCIDRVNYIAMRYLVLMFHFFFHSTIRGIKNARRNGIEERNWGKNVKVYSCNGKRSGI